ncbi:hypothetical protein [Lactobacillus sp. ESL0681]|uniref:hypothetical protein n=1 Tax=Lactobacillus sp. ESL0681 TaxID=2983211 RepID=UPI0023F79F7D|nr:hypothetical protein [Lactobacillus sp. ESL0681]WEV41304.1 hypothetical protein OZX59_09245 [Lactobacillus sp. ESL0681]
MHFARINRNKLVIRYGRPITETEIMDTVYVLRLFDNSQYFNVGGSGYFLKESDIILMGKQQARAKSNIRKIDHLYTLTELYDQIYEGWSFGSNTKPAKLICKRKYPHNHVKRNLRLVNVTRKYGC